MGGYIDTFYGVQWAVDFAGILFTTIGWYVLSVDDIAPRWTQWLWLTGTLGLAVISHFPILLVACVRDDLTVAPYHAAWVLVGIPVVSSCWHRLLADTAPSRVRGRQRRQIARAHRRILAEFDRQPNRGPRPSGQPGA